MERGGLFQDFCDTYRSFLLQDIQRQKIAAHRQFVKELAFGKTAQALDAFAKEGLIRWRETKREVMQALIHDWALENPAQTLIKAHSNAEVAVLNELARAVRKEKRQISAQDYACQMRLGRGYISEGDLIEFRGKLPDGVFSVNNGTRGRLVKASADEFAVELEQGNIISFDPRSFHNYQLGYAVTYDRAQGETKTATFPLYSAGLTGKDLYVGLSRHTDRCGLYVAKEDASCLAEVKLQVLQNQPTLSNICFTCKEEILLLQKERAKPKTSQSFLSKIKALGIKTSSFLQFKIQQLQVQRQDRLPSHDYFHPHLPHPPAPVSVEAIQETMQKKEWEEMRKAPLKNSEHLPFPLKKLTFYDLVEKYNAHREETAELELKLYQSANAEQLKKAAEQLRLSRLLKSAAAYLIDEEAKVDPWKCSTYYLQKGEERLRKDANRFAEAFSGPLHCIQKDRVLTDLIDLYHASIKTLLVHKKSIISAALGDSIEKERIDIHAIGQQTLHKQMIAFAITHRLAAKSSQWEYFFSVHDSLILKGESTSFLQSLRPKELLVSKKAQLSYETRAIIDRYRNGWITIAESRRSVAIEMSQTGQDPTAKTEGEDYTIVFNHLLQNYQQKDALAFLLTESLTQEASLHEIVSPKEAGAILIEADKFAKRYALKDLLKDKETIPADVKGIYQSYVKKVKEATLRAKILQLEAARSGEKVMHVEGFFDYQRVCNERNQQGYALYHKQGVFQERLFTEEGLNLLMMHRDGFERSVTPSPLIKPQVKLASHLSILIADYQDKVALVMECRKELALKNELTKEDFQKLKKLSSERNKVAFEVHSELKTMATDLESLCFAKSCHALEAQAELYEKGTRKRSHFHAGAQLPEKIKRTLDRYKGFLENVAHCRRELTFLMLKNPQMSVINHPTYIQCRECESHRNQWAHTLFKELQKEEIPAEKVFSSYGEKIARSHASQNISNLQPEVNPVTKQEKTLDQNSPLQKKKASLPRVNPSQKSATSLPEEKLKQRQEKRPKPNFSPPATDLPPKNPSLSPEKKNLLDTFIEKDKKAYALRLLVTQERKESGGLIKDQPSFKDWQQTCFSRNKSAYFLSSKFTKEELGSHFKQREVTAIVNQSARHLQTEKKLRIRQAEQKQKSAEIKAALGAAINNLTKVLFGDQVNHKMTNANFIRIGSKGALSVHRTSGAFRNFATEEKGDVIKLIEVATGKERKEAWEIAKDYLGQKDQIDRKVTGSFPKRSEMNPQSKWTSIPPPKQIPAPHFEELTELHKCQYIAHHDYKSEEGNVLFRTFRLKDSNGTKQIRIFSYGSFAFAPSYKFWANKHPSNPSLYNLDSLAKNRLATVVVVEGEKAADYASEHKDRLFPHQNLLFTTWKGGASGHAQTDWSPLAARNVVIWPDNDAAGQRAGEKIADTLLFQVGAKIVKIVSPKELFEKCPPSQVEKWDLADPLPEAITPKDLSAALRNAMPLHLLRDSVLMKLRLFHADFIEKQRIGDVVHRYEHRHKEDIKNQIENALSAYDKRAVLKQPAEEIANLIKNEDKLAHHFIKSPTLALSADRDQSFAKKLARQCTFYKIEKEKNPQFHQVVAMRNVIKEFDPFTASVEKRNSLSFQLAEQRTLDQLCREGLRQNRLIDPKDYAQAAREMGIEVKKIEEQKHCEQKQIQIEEQKCFKGFSW